MSSRYIAICYNTAKPSAACTESLKVPTGPGNWFTEVLTLSTRYSPVFGVTYAMPSQVKVQVATLVDRTLTNTVGARCVHCTGLLRLQNPVDPSRHEMTSLSHLHALMCFLLSSFHAVLPPLHNTIHTLPFSLSVPPP